MMMNQQGGMGSMSDALTSGKPMSGNNVPPYVNPTSMSPVAMSNFMGSPLANAGANMGHYGQAQQAMFPNMEQNSMMPTYARGGLTAYAEGGMPPPEDPMAGGEAPPQLGEAKNEWQGDPSPEIMQKVEQIFTENMENPEQLAQMLLQLVQEELKKALSPEELEQLHTPEGEAMLQEMIQQIMQQMGAGGGGALGELAQTAQGGGGAEGGAPPMAGGGGGLPPQ